MSQSLKFNFVLPLVGHVEMFTDSAENARLIMLELASLDRELEQLQSRYHEKPEPEDQDHDGDPAPDTPETPTGTVPEPETSGPDTTADPDTTTVTLDDLKAQLAPLIKQDRAAVEKLLREFVGDGKKVTINNVPYGSYEALQGRIEEMRRDG